MGSDGEAISYLVEHSMSLEDIQKLLTKGISLDEMRAAVESRLAQGLPVVDPPEFRADSSASPPQEVRPLAVISTAALQAAELPPVEFMNKILGGRPAPAGFYFATEAPRLDGGLLDTLDGHLGQHPDTRLIIIDTLQKVRGQALPREGAYAQDYREMETIKAFMDRRGVSVLFVHHNRKMKDDDDPFNMISGTNGIMGAADTIWTITKASRAAEEATLHITGRDVEHSSTVMRFDKDSWKWQPMGAADWLAEQRARLAYDGSPIVRTIKKLLDQSPGHRWDGTAKDLMDAGKYIARTYLAVNTTKLGHEIKALDKPLFEYDGIVHAFSKTSGNGGKKHSFYYRDLSRFEELEGEQEELPEAFREGESHDQR